MEILPSEYQNIELSRYEKMFVRHAISNDGYGFLLLKVNPTMIENESMNVLISSRGVVFFKFFEDFSDASLFGATMQPYTQFVYPTAKKIISEKLLVVHQYAVRFEVFCVVTDLLLLHFVSEEALKA